MIHSGKILLKRVEKDFEAGFCTLWEELADLSVDLSFLHPDEKAYYHALKVDRRKLSYLLGRKVAKTAISELISGQDHHSVCIEPGVFRFPVVKGLAGQNIQVSISHCDQMGIAIAFPEEHPMAIDIERVDPAGIETMKTLACPLEFELVAGCNFSLPIGCTLIWTIKEALSKVFKVGLTADRHIMEIRSLERAGQVVVSTFMNFMQYKAVSFSFDNYICSIVLPKNTTPLLENIFFSLK